MTKRFGLGLVIGKFAPLHLGHELVIRRAIEECDDVLVISYSKPELARCGPAARERWLAARFPNVRRVVLDAEAPSPIIGEIPPNDADPLLHRRFVARVCLDRGLTPDAVFTSESYGDGFARELSRIFTEVGASPVTHVMVDAERRLVPISGRAIRADVHAHREWLSPAVYADFVERIAILGGESSGKSSLAGALAARFDTTYVPEYGRTLWEERGGMLVYEDLLRIATTHVRMEEEAARRAHRYCFSDTTPLTTLFYSWHLFGRAEAELESLAMRRYDHVVLCAPDFPFVQDGTRGDAALREEQHECYLRELRRREIEHLLVTGSIEERMARVTEHLTRSVSPGERNTGGFRPRRRVALG